MSDEEMQRSYYAILPANVRYDSKLTPNAKLLYAEITALTNDKGYCWASNDYFAKLYGVSKTSISKWISQLVQEGFLDTELIYKKGTKIFEERRIYIAEKKPTSLRKVKDPIEKKLNTPIEKKLKENTKVFNTKNNRYKDILDIQPSADSVSSSSGSSTDKKTYSEPTQEMMDAQVGPKKIHPLTRELINQGIITEHDTDISKYNTLFFGLLEEHAYPLVAQCLNYSIKRMKGRDDISNKYAYLATSLTDGIDKANGNGLKRWMESIHKNPEMKTTFYNWLED